MLNGLAGQTLLNGNQVRPVQAGRSSGGNQTQTFPSFIHRPQRRHVRLAQPGKGEENALALLFKAPVLCPWDDRRSLQAQQLIPAGITPGIYL